MRGPSVLAAIDWTPVIVAIITLAGVIFTCATQVLFYFYIKPPSGGRLGRMLEETHAGTHVAVAAVVGLDKEDTNGHETLPPVYERRD